MSVSTLILGWRAYAQFLNKKVKEKQLDTVFELSKRIQKVFHYMHFNKPDPTDHPPLGIGTLFDIAEMKELDNYGDLFFWGTDSPEENEKAIHFWDFFFDFYSDPFLPNTIAKELMEFNFWQGQRMATYEEATQKKCVIMGRKMAVITPQSRCFYIENSSISTTEGFRKASKRLRDSIINWAKDYGIDDLNITSSHIHKMKK